MTSTALLRAIVGIGVIPNRVEDVLDVPTPYRPTDEQSRANWKVKGSQFGEPGEAVVPPIPE